MRPKKDEILKRQIKTWEDRVWIKGIEPPRTENKNENKLSEDELILDKISRLIINEDWDNIFTNNKFKCYNFNTKEDIYRVLRYGIERNKIYNSNILFGRVTLFDTYIMTEGSIKESYSLCKEMLDIISNDFVNKYLVVEDFDTEFDNKIASYFITQLIKNGCKGVIFNCNKTLPNTLLKCIKSNNICSFDEI